MEHSDQFRWIEPSDALLSDIFKKVAGGLCQVETKDFLRPIFKWLKAGGKHYNSEKAFSFADWVVMLR